MGQNNVKQHIDRWLRITPTTALYDRALLWLFIILLCLGLISVSSSNHLNWVLGRLFNEPFYFIKRDIGYFYLVNCFCVCCSLFQ